MLSPSWSQLLSCTNFQGSCLCHHSHLFTPSLPFWDVTMGKLDHVKSYVNEQRRLILFSEKGRQIRARNCQLRFPLPTLTLPKSFSQILTMAEELCCISRTCRASFSIRGQLCLTSQQLSLGHWHLFRYSVLAHTRLGIIKQNMLPSSDLPP